MRLISRKRQTLFDRSQPVSQPVGPADEPPPAQEEQPTDVVRTRTVDDAPRRDDGVDEPVRETAPAPMTTTDARMSDVARPMLAIPTLSPIAPIIGWIAAWGAITIISGILIEAGIDLGLGFGIADGSIDMNAGFWAGLWTLAVQAAAFVIGGYAAGRMARVRATAHAVSAWIVAMLATAADALVVAGRDSGQSILTPLHIPDWYGRDYDNSVVIPLALFAVGSLVGAVIGGMMAAGANHREVRDGIEAGDLDRVTHRPGTRGYA
jgi:hypothetical protein